MRGTGKMRDNGCRKVPQRWKPEELGKRDNHSVGAYERLARKKVTGTAILGNNPSVVQDRLRDGCLAYATWSKNGEPRGARRCQQFYCSINEFVSTMKYDRPCR